MGTGEKVGIVLILSILLLFLGLIFGLAMGTSSALEMQTACEKDLARNLKCEMVYVKPLIKEG